MSNCNALRDGTRNVVSTNEPCPGDGPSKKVRGQGLPNGLQRHHEGRPHGSQDISIPTPKGQSSGNGTTKRPADQITTEPGTDASHVPRVIPDGQAQGLTEEACRPHAHLVGRHQLSRERKMKNDPAAASGRCEEPRPEPTTFSHPSGHWAFEKQKPGPSNGIPVDDAGPRKGVEGLYVYVAKCI